MIERLDPSNIPVCFQIGQNFIVETGQRPKTSLLALIPTYRNKSDDILFSGEIEIAKTYYVVTSIEDRKERAKATTEFINHLFDRTVGYQLARARYALDQLRHCEILYKSVEKKKKTRASALLFPSLRSLRQTRIELESDVRDSIDTLEDEIQEIKGSPLKKARIGRRDWGKLLSEIEDDIVRIREKISEIADPIVTIEKENREINRVKLSVAAIVLAILAEPTVSNLLGGANQSTPPQIGVASK